MSKKRRSSSRRRQSIPKVWMYVGVSLLAVLTVGMVAVAMMQPSSDADDQAAPKQEQVIAAQTAPTPASAAAVERRLDLPPNPSVVVLGDSFVQGLGLADADSQIYPQLASDALEWGQVTPLGIGGTGVSIASVQGEPYLSRLQAASFDAAPDLFVIQGSINDVKASTVETDATALLAFISETWPQSKAVVIGPVTAHMDYMVLAATYQRAASKAGAFFIPATGADSWIPAAPNDLLQADGWHPSAQGQAAIAQGLGAALIELSR